MLLVSLTAVLLGAPSGIEEVILLADRAEVIRRGRSPCTNGAAKVEFERLPIVLDTRTLRAESTAETSVLSLRHEVEEGPDEPLAARTDERSALSAQRLALDHRRARLSEQKARLDRLTALYRVAVTEQMTSPRPPRSRWAQALDQLRSERTALAQARRKLKADEAAWARRNDFVTRKLQRRSDETRRSVRAIVSTACNGEAAEVRLAYVVPQARWRPEYDIDFRPSQDGRGQVRLTVSAIVEQSTGEDWDEIKLRLSTARPRLGADAPRLGPILLSGRQRKKGKVLVQEYERRADLSSGNAGGNRGPSGAQLDDGGTTVALTIPGRVTVLADGRKHWFPIDETRTDAQQKWVALPCLKRSVFRVAEFKNPAAYPLLAGRINTFIQGAFVGHSPLEFTATGEAREVSLGFEPGLALERKQRTDKAAVNGFLKRTKQWARAFRSTIANRSVQTITVEVREQIPVSQNEEIEVSIVEEGTTRPYRLDRDRGIVSWTVTVPAGKTQKVDFAYEIEFPDDWKVN